MPEAVVAFAEGGDFLAARRVQEEILGGYTRDFAKHIPARLLPRTMLAWESISGHLSCENKKFVFGQVHTVRTKTGPAPPPSPPGPASPPQSCAGRGRS